jgi:hypothetical protein
MINKKIVGIGVIASIILAGCTYADIQKLESDVQAQTALTCKFVPTVDSIVNLVSIFYPVITIESVAVESVAAAICKAVTTTTTTVTKSISRHLSVATTTTTDVTINNVTVKGVVITGYFIK